jgi:hypothetical protein
LLAGRFAADWAGLRGSIGHERNMGGAAARASVKRRR